MKLTALKSALPVLDPRRVKPVERKPWEQANEQRRLTGRPWRRLRERIMLRDKYLCQACLRAGRLQVGTECDHIVPLAQGGDDSSHNLEAICKPCHDAKTMREARIGKG